MGQPFDYSVSFQIRHPTAAAEELVAGLPWKMTSGWTVGQRRVTPTGRELGGVRSESYCSFDVARGDDGELVVGILQALDILDIHRGWLDALRLTGGRYSFYVFWYSNGDTGAVFEPDLLARMSSLKIDLGINVYDDRSAPGNDR